MSVLSRLLPRPATERVRAPGGVVIRPLRRGDVREVLPIERDAYPKPWSRAVFESELNQIASGARWYVAARRGRRLVGYAGLWFVPDPDGDQAHITNIVVASDARRRGLGAAMLLVLAGEALRRGCVSWTLEVRASNEAAQQLYRNFGFAPAGVRARYYENTEDAIVMWCHDLQSVAYAARLAEIAERLQMSTPFGGVT